MGTWVLRTAGDAATGPRLRPTCCSSTVDDWLANEIVLYLKRTLKRLDVTSRSLIALVEPGSCFAGSLLELALAADRSYQLRRRLRGRGSRGQPSRRHRRSADEPRPAADGQWPHPAAGPLLRRRRGARRARRARGRRARRPTTAEPLGLVTFAPDDIDWDDEVRIAIEERASFSPDALTGLEANYRFVGPETIETKIFGRLSAWQNWIFNRPNAAGPEGALRRYGTGQRPELRPKASLSHDHRRLHRQDPQQRRPARGPSRLQRALESWQPNFLQWWESMGPTLPTRDVYLRTAVNVGREGWANFDHVAMTRLPLGHLPGRARRAIAASASASTRANRPGRRCPGEYRAELQRLIVVQGDTEPASVEQQRNLGATAPSLYDLRNLFQVNVEEGRHLWAMVYLLHAYFGREGREEAEELLHRHSGSEDVAAHPRRVQRGDAGLARRSSCSRTSPTATASTSWARCKESAFDPLSPDVRVHAQGGVAPHVRRHDRHRPGRRAHRAADGRARHRRRRPRTAAFRWT